MFLFASFLLVVLAAIGIVIFFLGYGRNTGVVVACIAVTVLMFSIVGYRSYGIEGAVIHLAVLAGSVWLLALSPWARKLYRQPGEPVSRRVKSIGLCLTGLAVICGLWGPTNGPLLALLMGTETRAGYTASRVLGMDAKNTMLHLLAWEPSRERAAILREAVDRLAGEKPVSGACGVLIPELIAQRAREGNYEETRYLLGTYDTVCAGHLEFVTRKIRQPMDECDAAALQVMADAGLTGGMPVNYYTLSSLYGPQMRSGTIADYARHRECAAGVALFPGPGPGE